MKDPTQNYKQEEKNSIDPDFSEADKSLFTEVRKSIIEVIQQEIESHGISPSKVSEIGALKVQTANEVMIEASKLPIPVELFGPFWCEGEIGILFGDTGVGKSILGVQIANSISKGVSILDLYLKSSSKPVGYFDFELSTKQFEKRYSIEYKHPYEFSDNLYRVSINQESDCIEELEDQIIQAIEKVVLDLGIKVIIIDNITFLRNDTEKAKEALPLMKKLIALKREYNLSILILAHTPKRDATRPINNNDLAGSKMLMNFCDSAFAIGASFNDPGIRYLKQIKCRSTETIYDQGNVLVCSIEKDNNFLQFNRIATSAENAHLKARNDEDKLRIKEEALELHNKGLSFREIGNQLGFSHTKAKRIVDEAKTERD
ncbi:MAG: AAA family ATPase [Saprospiraceae bacterium]|nr:AAA family ATPase [Saprospiraceae bacterium]